MSERGERALIHCSQVKHCEIAKQDLAADFVEGPLTDPREVFRPDEERVKRFLGVKPDKDELPPSNVGRYQEYRMCVRLANISKSVLILRTNFRRKSFDPKTQICSFELAGASIFILH